LLLPDQLIAALRRTLAAFLQVPWSISPLAPSLRSALLPGHVPLLADPDFAALAQAIGLASLVADDATMWHLTKVYW
jgi:hypothetical protein